MKSSRLLPLGALLSVLLHGSVAHGVTFPLIEAENGTLGADFSIAAVSGALAITCTSNGSGSSPGTAARVASYSVVFPSSGTYQFFARLRVGPNSYNDDSFFHGSGFGAKNPSTGSDWIGILSGLVETGFTLDEETVTVGGGSSGTQVWKWVRFPTFFTVTEGALTRTFQIGAREDGLVFDKFAFLPADAMPTVANLNAGVLPDRPTTERFTGADGTAIHRFDEPYKATNLEGSGPVGGLLLREGALWGTASAGGLQGRGTLFEIGRNGESLAVRHTFGISGASHPSGALVEQDGLLYGVSRTGGASGTGSVFRVATDGSVTMLRSFAALASHTGTNTGGASPSGQLALASGKLYGAAAAGGASGQGVLYALNLDGTGFTVLREFDAVSVASGSNQDGARPSGPLVALNGQLFGVTQAGGAAGAGVVFRCGLAGEAYTVLHTFEALSVTDLANAGGAQPTSGLTLDNGRLYGSTLLGGSGGSGVLFSILPDGSGFTVLHAFSPTDPAGNNAGGATPTARPVVSGNMLYGTTSSGGHGGTGVVYALDTNALTLTTLHHFEPLDAAGKNRFGAYPVAELLRAGNTLYGTAHSGGPGGTGVVFAIPIPVSTSLEASASGGSGLTVIFRAKGAPFASYTVQAAAELTPATNWQDVLTTNSDAGGRIAYAESNISAQRRFFRLVENP